jgi:hypothetical protein
MVYSYKISVKKPNLFISWNYREDIVAFALDTSLFNSHRPSAELVGGL